jgi:hypothetical protein
VVVTYRFYIAEAIALFELFITGPSLISQLIFQVLVLLFSLVNTQEKSDWLTFISSFVWHI